mmetsp:Transcript_13750/g.51328  ORF Transcript_13750/g.51328 Transcript_13750/m.51328 type:complete len:223 (-) Transcript_13750:533-1201(-)
MPEKPNQAVVQRILGRLDMGRISFARHTESESDGKTQTKVIGSRLNAVRLEHSHELGKQRSPGVFRGIPRIHNSRKQDVDQSIHNGACFAGLANRRETVGVSAGLSACWRRGISNSLHSHLAGICKGRTTLLLILLLLGVLFLLGVVLPLRLLLTPENALPSFEAREKLVPKTPAWRTCIVWKSLPGLGCSFPHRVLVPGRFLPQLVNCYLTGARVDLVSSP